MLEQHNSLSNTCGFHRSPSDLMISSCKQLEVCMFTFNNVPGILLLVSEIICKVVLVGILFANLYLWIDNQCFQEVQSQKWNDGITVKISFYQMYRI